MDYHKAMKCMMTSSYIKAKMKYEHDKDKYIGIKYKYKKCLLIAFRNTDKNSLGYSEERAKGILEAVVMCYCECFGGDKEVGKILGVDLIQLLYKELRDE